MYEAVEKREMVRLSCATQQRVLAEEAVAEWQERLAHALERLRRLYLAETVSLADVEREQAYCQWVRAQLNEALGRLDEALRLEEEARAALDAAMRRRKTMERLRERHADAYWREEERKERAFLDEVGAHGYRSEAVHVSL